MSETKRPPDETDIPPGHGTPLDYEATGGKRGGGIGEFLWFVTADRTRDQVFPAADIRRMSPPTTTKEEVAYIHFSGVSAALHGVNLRRVLHRITLRRCAVLYEIEEGQRRPPKGEPVIERMEFFDLSKPAAPAPKGGRLKERAVPARVVKTEPEPV